MYPSGFPFFILYNFTECDRISTLWVSESISPLSKTDDVVHKKKRVYI